MLDSIPVPLQAIVWLYAGAAIILVLGRLLPNWIRRLAAVVFAVASLGALRTLLTDVQPVEIFWEPLNLFRMSPVLYPDSLSLLGGLTLSGVVAVLLLGIRGSNPQKTAWHGLILAVLAGCLFTMMAANLLTVALGSALIDLALLALALSSVSGVDRTLWRMAVPGVISTFLLFVSALRMDTQVGTASFLARSVPEDVLLMVGVAGLLRLMILPLHPRRLDAPESAATVILPVGAGIYLLARVESLGPVLAEQPWAWIVAAVALLAGGVLVWAGSVGATRKRQAGGVGGTILPGLIVQQTGCALAYILFVSASLPWPLISLSLIIGLLTIWWDSNLKREPGPQPAWVEWLIGQIQQGGGQVRAALVERFPWFEQQQVGRIIRRGTALPPALALLAVTGVPLTLGIRIRWPLYAHLLKEGVAAQLLIVLIADALLAAGLLVAVGAILRGAGESRPKPAAILALAALAIPLVVLGVAPGILSNALALPPIVLPDVSIWGLGLIFVLPWLVGAWISRFGDQLERPLAIVRQVALLEWLYRAADWAGQRLAGIVYWLGQVGEGDGWWGWALIILALGAVFLAAR